MVFAPAPFSDPVTLPIRVYAPNGADAHVEEVTLHVDDASSVDSLYVQAHQPFYHRGGNEKGQHEGFEVEGAASIRINNGSWIDVTNETVDCPKSEENHGQCIGGVFSTVRFTVPASTVQSGPNQIDFRFNGTDGIRSGYRVLTLGFMRPADPPVQTFDPQSHGAHDASQLQSEDFSSWSAPDGYDSPSAVAAGKELFESAALLESLGGDPIEASCNDCHSRDGRDLKYFNYSNRALVSRSRFHGLSEEEGKQIAAYIRSIQLEKRDGSTYEAPGTPWNPPYQPGPTLQATQKHPDASNQVYWASGAGLEQVLNKDRDMLPHLFPDGQGGVDYYTTPNGRQALRWRHVHMDSTLNMRELPISLQLPDWNNWLPDVHPMDAFPSQWANSGAKSTYENDLRSELQTYSGGTDLDELSDIENTIQNLHIGFATSLKGATNETGLSENKFTLAHLSNHQWLAVKVWESFHMHHLEDVADEMYEDRPKTPFSEPRSWMGGQRTLFDLGPNIALPNGIGGGPPYQYGSAGMDGLFSHVWYQLQVTVNPGSGPRNVQHPMDWNYHDAYLKGAPNAGLRTIASHVKANQLLSNGYGVDGTGGDGFERSGFVKGWHPFTTDPVRFLQLKGHPRYSNLSASLREDLYTATLRAWNDFNMRFPVEEFPRDGESDLYNPPDYVPSAWGNTSPHDHADKIYQALYQTGDQFPEAFGAMDTLATWGAQMWPDTEGPEWKNLVDYFPPGEGAPPSLQLATESSGSTVWGTAPTLVADVSDPDNDDEIVEFFLGDEKIGSATEPPYEIHLEDVPYNRYRIDARVRDEENLIGRDTLSLTVGPSDPPDTDENGLYFAYLESDPERRKVPDFSTLRPLRGGMADQFDLSALDHHETDFAARYFGYIEIPEDGTYTFYTYSSDGTILTIDGQRVVDNDGRHISKEKSGKMSLSEGRHRINLGYFMRGGQRSLEVRWSGPNISKTEVPNSRLYRTNSSGELPVEMTRFNGVSTENGHVRLTWQTGSETNNAGFALQRRTGESGAAQASWKKVGFIDSKAPGGTTTEPLRYQFVDEEPPYEADTLGYRLRQVDVDGTATVSETVRIERSPDKVELRKPFPNPTRTQATIRYDIPRPQRVRLELYDLTGRRVRSVADGQKEGGRHQVSLDVSELPSGLYFYQLSAGETSETRKLMIVR